VITVLAGGVGAARFLRGLLAVVPADEVTAIVNVGDELDHLGLRICPDLDTITYWLAGLVHPEQQWGRAEERFTVRDELVRLGHTPWFTLGDRDLALHLHRNALLQTGVPLSAVAADLAHRLDIALRLTPVSDDRITTRIHTIDGRDLHFQEWWVRERAASDVVRVEYRGAADALPAPGVVEAILDATLVILAPSNPVVSIAPITAVPAVAAALTATPAPIVGVSPIVDGRVVRGMAHRLLPAVGAETSAAGVARLYGARRDGGLLDGWVLDTVDAARSEDVPAAIATAVVATLMDDPDVAARLASAVLELGSQLRAAGGRR